MESNIKIFGTLKSSEYTLLRGFVQDESNCHSFFIGVEIALIWRILDDVSVLRYTIGRVADFEIEATQTEVSELRGLMHRRAELYPFSVHILEQILAGDS